MSGAEGSPRVYRYDFVTGEYMKPSTYGGLGDEIDNRNTRMNRSEPSHQEIRNYMRGTGNQPMDRGGPNLFPSATMGYQYMTGAPPAPASAMPFNANEYPAQFNHHTGQRVDPQSYSELGTVTFYNFGSYDKHFDPTKTVGEASFSGMPNYLGAPDLPSRTVAGRGRYLYRQYADGTIQILQGPQGIGTIVSPQSRIGQAITAEIGQYPSTAVGAKIQQVKDSKAGSFMQQLLDTASSVATSIEMKSEAEIARLEAQERKRKQERNLLYAAAGVAAAIVLLS